MRQVFLTVILICLGCETPEKGLWIDDACSATVEENLIEATARLWDEAGIDVEILGRKDLSEVVLDPNTITGVKCLPAEEAPEPDLSGYVTVGLGSNRGIYLYGGVDNLPTIMHELGHYVGMDHVDDPEAVMYPIMVGNEHYTDADLESID